MDIRYEKKKRAAMDGYLFTKNLIEDQLRKQERVTTAHNKLLMTLARLEAKQGELADPEMVATRRDQAIKEFFTEINYPDITTFLGLLKTY